MSIEDLLRFREGSANADETVAIGQHLATCEACAAIAGEMFADEAEGFAAAVRTDAAPPRSMARMLAVAAAVALLLIAAAAIILFTGRNRTTPSAPKTASAPAPNGYGRADWDALVGDAVKHGRVVISAPSTPAPEVLRDGSARNDIGMTPSATTVESTQPDFSWPEVAGAQYVVSVVAAGDRVIAQSPTLDRNRWTPERPLPRDAPFTWQVRATRGDQISILPPPPQPHPAFSVISDDALRDLDAARRRFPNDHLLLGVLAARDGLRDLARHELERNAAEHPSPVAARLVASVQ